MAGNAASLKAETSTQGPSPKQHAREPLYNNDGKLYCNNPSCQGKNLTFKRPSDWKKHVDRHERPYKCIGRLTAHARIYLAWWTPQTRTRSAKMESTSEEVLFCPFPKCKRGSGKGLCKEIEP